MNDSLIHLRVPAATKGRWVRASRAAGQRLTDYITTAVEAHMQQQIARVVIPDDLTAGTRMMTPDQFAALAELLRLRGGPSEDAARLVLVEGLTPAAAARQAGASPQAVSNAVTRCRRGLELVAIAYGAAESTS